MLQVAAISCGKSILFILPAFLSSSRLLGGVTIVIVPFIAL